MKTNRTYAFLALAVSLTALSYAVSPEVPAPKGYVRSFNAPTGTEEKALSYGNSNFLKYGNGEAVFAFPKSDSGGLLEGVAELLASGEPNGKCFSFTGSFAETETAREFLYEKGPILDETFASGGTYGGTEFGLPSDILIAKNTAKKLFSGNGFYEIFGTGTSAALNEKFYATSVKPFDAGRGTFLRTEFPIRSYAFVKASKVAEGNPVWEDRDGTHPVFATVKRKKKGTGIAIGEYNRKASEIIGNVVKPGTPIDDFVSVSEMNVSKDQYSGVVGFFESAESLLKYSGMENAKETKFPGMAGNAKVYENEDMIVAVMIDYGRSETEKIRDFEKEARNRASPKFAVDDSIYLIDTRSVSETDGNCSVIVENRKIKKP